MLLIVCNQREKRITMKIAETILSQIKTLDPSALMAWGAKNLTITSKDALQFKSSGMCKWKGFVTISLDRGADTYVVKFQRLRKMELITDKLIRDVYAMDLINVIDAQVG